MGYLRARGRGLSSNPQLLRVQQARERAPIPSIYERERGQVMTRDMAERIYSLYEERVDLIPLITAIKSVEYYRGREGK